MRKYMSSTQSLSQVGWISVLFIPKPLQFNIYIFFICSKEHGSLAEELQHLKDSLLRDTNRGIDQQRVIDKMKAERRETICVQAHQRQELEKGLCEAEKKVSSIH